MLCMGSEDCYGDSGVGGGYLLQMHIFLAFLGKPNVLPISYLPSFAQMQKLQVYKLSVIVHSS